MKSRILALIMVVLCAIGLVALALDIVSNISPRQETFNPSKPDQAEVNFSGPGVASDAGDLSKRLVNDSRASANVPRAEQAARGTFAPPSWRPSAMKPPALADPSTRQNGYSESLSRQSHRSAVESNPGSAGSPAERARELAAAGFGTFSPVAGLGNNRQQLPGQPVAPDAYAPAPAGVNVDMAFNVVFGYLSAGDLVTVAASGGSAFGTAQADGAGFFFTPLWGADGRQVDLVGGETIDVYVSGAYLDSISLPSFSGQLDVTADQVTGSLTGLPAGSVVTASLGIWGWEPNTETPWITTTTDSQGDFTAAFGADLGPHNLARVEANTGTGRVYAYAYPLAVFNIDSYGYMFGYGQPFQPVTITVYISDTGVVRGSQTVWGNWPHGDYSAALPVEPGDTVEVDQGGGNLQTMVAGLLTANLDLAGDQVTGTAPALQAVRVFIFDWMLGAYAETVTTADASGYYTATFSSHNLTAQDSIYPAYADSSGSEVLLSIFPPRIQVFPDWDSVIGSGDAPHTPFTYTLTHAGSDYTISGQTDDLNGTGWADFSALGVDVSAGDLVTLETPTWSGSMVVADLALTADTTNDRYLGSADQPGEVSVASFHWPPWSYPVNRFASGAAPASANFTISLPGHDVRAGVSGRVIHNDTNSFTTRKNFEVRYFDLDLPWGVSSPQYAVEEVITATLFSSDQLTVKRQVSRDDDGNPNWYWLDFGGEIAAGDWMSVTNGADWGAWLQVPDLTVTADRATDLISGTAPETLLYVESGNDQSGLGTWTPSYTDGAEQRYVVDASAFGVDLDFGTWTTVYYQALDGNRARRSSGFPDLYARYNPDGSSSVFGNNAIPGNTIYITITNALSEVVASGTTAAGTAWMGPTSYNLDFPFYGFSPGDVVHIDYGSGLTNSLLVVELTAQADIDTDLVTGLAPADSWLNAWINAVDGNNAGLDQVQVSSVGTYTMDFGAIGWDIKNGDGLSVYYPAGHGGVVERAISLPRPELNFATWNTNGGARPGGPYAYGVWLSNDGDLAAENVQVVLTLPPDTSWAGDTSGVTPQIGANGVITWNLGMLAAYEQHNYFITVQLDPAHPTGDEALGPLCGTVSTSTSGDSNPDNNSSCSGSVFVDDDEIDIRVDKWPNPGDVVAGQEFDYQLQYCNDRSTAAGPVWLTDTLPAATSFISVTPRNWWGEVHWSELAVHDGVVQMYFPSIPGQNCTDLNLRLRADADLPLNTTLSNRVEVFTAGDIDPNNNWRLNEDGRISTPRADLYLGKYLDGGILVPGGEASYKLDYYNGGNIALSGRLTDTLPVGTAYVPGSAYDYNWQPVEPILVTADQVVWDVGEIGVNRGSGLTYRLSIDSSVTPGATLLNCAAIGHTFEEDTPWNNTACDERSIYEHGPNLHVNTQYWWNGDSQLGLQIDFANWGDEVVSSFWITDVLPDNTQWDGWWNMNWDWNRLLSTDHGAGHMRWEFRDIYPGDSGWIQFNANLDDPNARPRTYTNTAYISLYPEDTNPSDNSAAVSVVLGEVERVELWLGTDNANLWGEAQPDSTVSVLNRGVIYNTYANPDCGGCWDIGDIGPLWPGDTFTVTAGAGLLPVVIHVPDPFSVAADSRSDQVTGQLSVDPGSWLRVELYGYSGKDTQVDASGFYTVTFSDIPRGGDGHVRYETTIDYAQAVFHRYYRSPDLIMSANYAHDWVQGRYDVGHTVWITVTESDGVSEKAHAQVTTYNIPWWNGDSGFEPQQEDWIPSQPDIQEGDWVYGLLDNGYTSTLRIGAISGVVDAGNDRIDGTVLADWITERVDLRCHTWGSPNNAPQKQDIVQPDGVDVYSCAWDPVNEWDVQGGQDIGVEYYEPDGDSVFNVFHAPSPNLQVQINPHGNPGEGGNLQLQIQYVNQGELDSNNVVITQTLEGMQYLGNTSAFGTLTGTTPGGDPYVVYQLGTLPPGNWTQFDVFAQVTAPASQTITSTVHIAGTPDAGNEWEKEHSWSGHVSTNDTHINLGKGAWTGDPTPGGQFTWELNACSNGSTSSSAIYITDTLPAHMTLIDWWGRQAGWTEVARDAAQLVVMRPTLPNGWCSQVELVFQVDADVPIGTNVLNSADVWAANDIETHDNHTENWVSINGPHTNLNISMWWGQGSLVPGGTFRYHMNYNNNGNVPVDSVYITDTLPVSTTLDHVYRYDRDWNFLGEITPVYLPGNQIRWEVGRIENGEWGHFEVSVIADSDAVPGTTLVNTAEISYLPGEDNYTDNVASWTETLFEHGPNLRLTKRTWWNGDSQLGYQIDFANVGDQTVSSFWITDVLPANTQWDGWWNMGWDWNRLISTDLHTDQLRWEFRDIYPADGGWLQLNANLDDPNARPRWYTNTAEISLYPDDTNPADNTATTSTVLGEVDRVEMWVSPGSNGIWGEAQPGTTVTITTPYEQLTTWADPNCSGCWGVGTSSSLQPGDLITVAAGLGQLPVVISVPDPFTVQADSGTDTVWGQIDSLNKQSVQVALYGYPGTSVQTDEHGNFVAAFADIPPAGNGEVGYETTIDYARVYFHYRFQADDLLLRINYAHEWLQAIYPAGHTVWITLTNSLGQEKATYQGVTNLSGAWNGADGFETQGHLWWPAHPNIEAGDWVYARSDDGRTNQLQIGEIAGELDLLADSISGNLTAPFTTTLRITCQLWVENAPPQIEGSVDPAGGSYTCSWAGIYDLQPDMNVAVIYSEPDNDEVINVFWVGRPHLTISKWGDGQPGEGGNYTFHISYNNQGYDVAEAVVITDTLSAGMTYLDDTAPFPLLRSNPLVWDLGSLPNGSSGSFDLYVQVDAPAGTPLTNTAQIETSTPWDTAPPESKVSVWTGSVQLNDTHLNIGIGPSLGDPSPGSQYFYGFNVCNNGPTASSGVLLTATLPVSTTYTGMSSSPWSEVSASGQQVVLSHPSVGGWSCASANLNVLLDGSAPEGLLLEASGVFTASNDLETTDNQAAYQHTVGAPRIDQWVAKYHNSGLLVPGSTLQFQVNYDYDANFAPGSLTITDTLPVDTTFLNAWHWGPSGQEYLTPLASGPGYVVFEFSDLTANSYGGYFFVDVQIDPAAVPGTELINRAQIQAHPVETYLENNSSSWIGTLLDHHADLGLSAWGGWDLINNLANLSLQVNNFGDLGAGSFTITATYPVSMSLAGDISGDWRMTAWQDYPDQHYFTATFSHLEPQNGTQINFNTQMVGGGPIPGGQVFEFNYAVSLLPEDINPDNNHASFDLTSGPDLFVEKTISDGSLIPGGSVTYRLHVGNRPNTGSWSLQGSVRITDTLPAGLAYAGSSWGPILVDGQTIVWDVGYQPGGWDSWFDVYATITNTASVGDVFTNTANIASTSSADIDIHPGDNTSTQAFTIMLPVFDISKQAGGNLVAGMPVTYTLSVTNTGNLTGTNIQIYDALPPDLAYTASDGWWDGAAVHWTVAQLAPQESAQVWFSAVLPSSAGITVTNQDYQVIASDQGVSSPVGAPVSFTVRAPTLAASFDQSATSVEVGTTVYFTDTSTTDGVPIVGWSWDLGEGLPVNGTQNVSYIYATPGDYTVTLLITDSLGFTASTGNMVHVLPASGEPHFVDCADQTGNNATVTVPLTVTIIEGLVLEAGDEIAVFNSGNHLCAGFQNWTGVDHIDITAWGDDLLTPEVDGLVAGEAMRYRIWDASEQVEYDNVTATYSQGDGIYAAGSYHIVEVLDLHLTLTREISLNAGWNLIALPLEPTNAFKAQSLLNDINGQGGVCDEIDRWINGGWDAHINGLPFNDFDILAGQGYFVKCSAPGTWTVEGQAVTSGVPLSLSAGWNLVGVPYPASGYTAQSLLDGVEAQGGACTEIDRWLNGGWDAHIDGLPFNDFPIETDEGYFLRCTQNSTFTPSASGLQAGTGFRDLLQLSGLNAAGQPGIGPYWVTLRQEVASHVVLQPLAVNGQAEDDQPCRAATAATQELSTPQAAYNSSKIRMKPWQW